jgi:benzil reductase ((S)-benzoin forming)
MEDASMKAVVTGHTKGLGAAIAKVLLERGIPVLGVARHKAPDLATYAPGLLIEAEIDLSDAAALTEWLAGDGMRKFLEGSGTALLINNAGVVWPVGPLHEQDPNEVIRAVTLNVAAPLALAAAVVRACPGTQKRILHISSGAGRNPYPGWSVYGATKAALDQHARAVALDNDNLVRICSLAPGVIDTGMQAEIRATPDERFPLRQRFVQMKQEGALASPEATARAVIDYLLSVKFGSKPVDDLRHV